SPLQLVIQRLQGECEQLRAEKRDLERKVQHETLKSSRYMAETNDMQRNLMVENQRLQSEVSHMKDKLREYAATLELANDRLKQVDASERQLSLRCEVLDDTVRELEAMTARQRQSMDGLENDVDRLNELVAHLGDERDELLERTEVDAKRVRALWEETMLQHKAEATSLERAVERAKKEARVLQTQLNKCGAEAGDMRTKLSQASVVASQDSQRIQKLELEVVAMRQELGKSQQQTVTLSQSLQTVALQVEEQASKLRWTEAQLHDMTKTLEDTKREAATANDALQQSLEQLDVLKTEFATSMETYEGTIHDLRHGALAKTSQVEQLRVALNSEKKYAASIAAMLKTYMGDYHRVLSSVDHKLSDLKEHCHGNEDDFSNNHVQLEDQESYEKSIKEISEFRTVQGFWRVYNHLIRPNDLPNTTDYHLFKAGIKPMWEVLAIVGEQFDVGNEICGAVMSIRYNEDIISLWNRNADNSEACYRIRDTMRKLLNLPQFVSLEYKRHDTSLNDNSSFRNTTVWRNGEKARLQDDGTPMSPSAANAGQPAANQQQQPPPSSSRHPNGPSQQPQQQSRGDRSSGTNRSHNRREGNNTRGGSSGAWTRDTTIREKKDRTSSFSRNESTPDEEGWQS
ncbi:hypothetical protein DYB31_004388, partial [Aphanomyces astaci]